jgi:hypothetical protein
VSNDEQGKPVSHERAPWFRPNRSGPGWHPSAWQGWLIIVAVVAVIVALVVLLRTGVL